MNNAKFSKDGRLYTRQCACGKIDIEGLLLDESLVKSAFGERDFAYTHGILSRECGRKYYDPEISPTIKIRESCSSPTILVADDDHTLLKIIPRILTSGGYKNITTVNNGRDALSELVSNHYTLFITDNHMPHLTGYEVIQHYKKSPKVNGTRFIGMSGLMDDNLDKIYRSLGAAVLTKPFAATNFLDVVEQTLKLKK